MSFTFSDNEKEIWSCTKCRWISTKRHFDSNGDSRNCVYCSAPAEKIGTKESHDGMPSYEYQRLLSYLEDEVTGVGSGTVTAIREHFDSGDDFINATNNAYDNRAIDELTCVDGVGESTAEAIAHGIADEKGWEGGMLESTYSLSA